VETTLLDCYRQRLRHLHTVGRGDQRTPSPVAIDLAEARLLAPRARRANQQRMSTLRTKAVP